MQPCSSANTPNIDAIPFTSIDSVDGSSPCGMTHSTNSVMSGDHTPKTIAPRELCKSTELRRRPSCTVRYSHSVFRE
jgi:hypothetical protein